MEINSKEPPLSLPPSPPQPRIARGTIDPEPRGLRIGKISFNHYKTNQQASKHLRRRYYVSILQMIKIKTLKAYIPAPWLHSQ